MLSKTVRVLRASFLLVLTIIVIEAVLDIYMDTTTAVRFALYTIAAFYFHRTVLIGAPYGPATQPDSRLPERDWPETPPWRIFLFMAGLVLVSALVMVLTHRMLVSPGTGSGLTDATTTDFLFVFAFGCISIWLILSLFGTAVPAAVLRYNDELDAIFKRTRHSFFFIASRLLFGPGLLGLLNLVLILFLPGTETFEGFAEWTKLSDITPATAFLELVTGLLRLTGTAMTAAILSEGYLRAMEKTGQNVPLVRPPASS
ncbi:MAG: hypothetical protein AAF665_03555 [Pseudomonadota bacterium]